MYCRKCHYPLQATRQCCAECGHAFDPRDQRTFLTHKPGISMKRWIAGAVVLYLGAYCALRMSHVVVMTNSVLNLEFDGVHYKIRETSPVLNACFWPPIFIEELVRNSVDRW